jgi:cyclohexanecarboxylate-CoA ligase
VTGPDPRLRPDSRLTPALIERYEADGSWRRRSLRSFLSDTAAQSPSTLAAIGYRRGSLDEASALTYAQLDELSHALAAGLRSLGAGQGDVVAVMSHNRVELGALIFAINEIGAVYTGIPATYGAREVRQILAQSEAAVVVAEEGAPVSIVRALRADLPALRRLVFLPGAPRGRVPELFDGEVSYADLLRASERDGAGDDYAAPCHVGFTSGTTGAPKGVMNTAQTLESILRNWVAHVGPSTLGDPPVNLVASPVGHHTGFCWGVVLSAYLGGTSVFLDRWQPAVARAAIDEQRVTTMFCAPTFVQDLIAADGPATAPSLRMITVAGAPVPRALPAVAGEALGCEICPAWGMTEYAIGVSWGPSLGRAALETDGVAAPGAEIRVVDASGEPVAAGEVGDFQVRGPGLFLGYLRRPEENAASFVDGWFRTGDTATIDANGYVRFVGRSKDIVIRGGENIPVVEVESLLFGHPKVRDVAVVGVPDVRLGQRACAVVVAAPGEAPTLLELCGALRDQGLSTRFLPERLELVEELPKTPSGKIRKVELRERFG